MTAILRLQVKRLLATFKLLIFTKKAQVGKFSLWFIYTIERRPRLPLCREHRSPHPGGSCLVLLTAIGKIWGFPRQIFRDGTNFRKSVLRLDPTANVCKFCGDPLTLMLQLGVILPPYALFILLLWNRLELWQRLLWLFLNICWLKNAEKNFRYLH